MIKQIDAIELLKSLPDKSVDLIFTDPPYALGSEVIIREDGKPDYKKAVDFMNKWDQPDGKFWEEWFKEANRVLKYGGRVLMFGMDRQLMLNKYYACFAGLQEQQSLYWYFASSFPKASDLSKNLDKYFGEEREVVGKGVGSSLKKQNEVNVDQGFRPSDYYEDNDGSFNITKPSSPLAQKYDGFKYSISPIKQTNETIMVFQKPYKTGSCLHDTLKYENGDKECCCGALNIDGNRVPIDLIADKSQLRTLNRSERNNDDGWGMNKNSSDAPQVLSVLGRFPAQSFVDSETAKLLDEQSGIKQSAKSTKVHIAYGTDSKFGGGLSTPDNQYDDIGGCSKILHKCDYDEKDIELYYYCPKVDKKERNMGLKGKPKQQYSHDGRGTPIENAVQRNKSVSENNHPTVKPINLLLKILNLFKTPNPQVCVDTFAGSGSIPIAAELLGFEVIAGDLYEGFVEIANARLDYAIKNKEKLIKIYSKIIPKKTIINNNNDFF